MSAFKLYGGHGSSNTDRVRLTLAEGGITDFDFVVLNLRTGDQKSPDNLARHPWGKIPNVVFPDGLTLHESRPICKYLARKYKLPLLPPATDLEATALFEQAESVELQYFAEPAGKVSFEKFAKKIIGLPTDEAALAAALKATETFFDVVEPLLSKHAYMAGDSFTLVDIFYIPLVQRLFACGYGELITSRPHVADWWQRCTTRPAIGKLLAADRAAMAAMTKG